MLTQSLPLWQTAAMFRDDDTRLEAFLEDLCDRLDEFDIELAAFLPEPGRRERLLQEAQNLRTRFAQERPPLYGVPVGVKDIFHVEGFETRAGSSLPPEVITGPESDCVKLLRDAGALVLGKTVTTEFAAGGPGPTRNPHNPAHTPGGSSSGSAAAVAAGFCPLALGTQTVGSVIRPAAFCGTVGFKPTYGRIPSKGLIYYARSVDTIGFFCTDVAGAKLASSVLCPDWAGQPETPALPVLGVPEGPYLAQASSEALQHLERQLQRLSSAGYQIQRVPVLENVAEINLKLYRLIAGELAREHEKAGWFPRYRDLYGPSTLADLEEGHAMDNLEIKRLQTEGPALRRELASSMTWAGIGLWVSPSATGPAPAGLESTGDPMMNLPWTYSGVPVLNLPAGFSSGGLPLGLQFMAPFGEDETLLGFAGRIAEVLNS